MGCSGARPTGGEEGLWAEWCSGLPSHPCERKPGALQLLVPSPRRASGVGYLWGCIGDGARASGYTGMSAGRLKACVWGLEAAPSPACDWSWSRSGLPLCLIGVPAAGVWSEDCPPTGDVWRPRVWLPWIVQDTSVFRACGA
ncbi:hypothetical protein NDU88_007521 [Pleurodeles waltl]|uniref:Uncharacterized protein n=1 Tax=Pleurodeles waltl TaxID=8319 RepID=A0AAV7NWI2_PLEWA|nr:hypothetical protein NDU88_007521 [Pleurodeles waltl]